MMLPVIRKLATDHSADELNRAADAYENGRQNTLKVEGRDEAEILTNLLMAAVVRGKMESQGITLQEAIREHSKSVQKMLSGSKKPSA